MDDITASAHHKVDANKRWATIRAFTARDEDHLIRIAKSAGHLGGMGDHDVGLNPVSEKEYDFIIDVEHELYVTSTDSYDYLTNAMRLIHAFIHNGNYIRKTVKSKDVVHLTSDELLVDTAMDQFHKQMDMHEHRFKEMLQERFEEVEKTSGEGLLQCGRCKSTNVIWEQRQTRSADEGMTIIAKCMQCSNEWVMT